MKKMNRMMVVLALMTCGIGSSVYAAKTDVDTVFADIRRGYFADAEKVALTPDEILAARNEEGDTLLTEAVLSIKPAGLIYKDHRKAEKKFESLVSSWLSQLTTQQKKDFLDASNKAGKTALMIAAKIGFSDTVHFLHEAGASVLKTDSEGKRASEITRWKGIQADLKKWEKDLEDLIKEFEQIG